MTTTPTISALELFRFFQRIKGDEAALEVIWVTESSFALGDRGEKHFPLRPIGRVDQHMVKTAISLAIGTNVAEITEWSLSNPSIKETARAATLPWRRSLWIQGMLKWHFAPLTDFLNRNFGETALLWKTTARPAKTFANLAAVRLGFGKFFQYRVERAMRESLYAYLASSMGESAHPDNLKTLIQMFPFIVPMCATDKKKEHWIVITA